MEHPTLMLFAPRMRRSRPAAPGRRVWRSAPLLAVLMIGCSDIATMPELTPDHYVAAAVEHQWTPPADAPSYSPDAVTPWRPSPVMRRDRQDAPYTLAELLDRALSDNPDTRFAWESARASAAAWGIARAKYYPNVSTETDFEYSRTLFQIPGGTGRAKTAQITPMVELTYTLLDFGRRRADDATAAAQLAAANFSFNRRLQDVVFNTQRFFFGLAAAKAGVSAAHQNLELARTDDDAVGKRVDNGLATQPALLLARQRVAQAEYDVASAELLVQEAQANLALAIGIPANAPIEVEGLEHQALPTTLDGQVDDLIRQAIRSRPDLAASVAEVRADRAQVQRAQASFMPQVDLLGEYGEQNWGYTFNAAPQIQANMPEYSALLALKWDIFTGFARLNEVREGQARQRAARAALVSQELTATAEVWRAYYEFQSSRKKYDYAKALLAASQESYNALIDTYRQGLSTIVELLSAQRDLANARYTMIQATADLLTSSASVAYAVGGAQGAGSH